ncbi:MAG: hypothetical protein IJD40_01250 [Lachnospiraceae bacterium]|nr:hypothetical protein [Lachnospiraceae bacterium]
MNRKTKKTISLLLSFVLIFMSVFINANATDCSDIIINEINPIDFDDEYGIAPAAWVKPDEAWDWSEGRYNFGGTSQNVDLYSNYYFTNASKLRITVENECSFDIKVKLLKQQTGIDWSVSTETVAGGETESWTVTVSSSEVYILKFYCPTSFEGYIEKLY